MGSIYMQSGAVATFIGHFIASGVAATGLTVTAKVWEVRSDGSKVPDDLVGDDEAVTEIGEGFYMCQHTMTGDGIPACTMTTADTADQKAVPVLAIDLTTLANLDTPVSDVYDAALAAQVAAEAAQAAIEGFSSTGELAIGNGLGNTLYSDTLTTQKNKPISGAVVRAFPYIGGLADFNDCIARTTTANNGDWEAWLDHSNDYAIRIEKGGTMIYSGIITVDPPT